MTTWLFTRHPGAVEWAARQGLRVDRPVEHLDVGHVQAGDAIIGTLPVTLAARVCERGAKYFNLSLELPAEARGRELTLDDLERYGARVQEFQVRACNSDAKEVVAMKTQKVRSGGRVTLPAPVRTQLGLKTGDTLLWEVQEGYARLRRLGDPALSTMAASTPAAGDGQ